MTKRLASGTVTGRFMYHRKPHEAGSLIEKVRSKAWAPRSLVLIRDAFDKNVALGELEGAELDQLTEVLAAKESFLVLTTELGEEALNTVRAPKVLVEMGQDQYQEILINHLQFYGALNPQRPQAQIEKAVLRSWAQLRDLFKTPFHVDRFCEQVQELQRLDTPSLEALARSVGQVDRKAMQLWFEGLKSNEKLVAMLIYLFDGLDATALEDLAMEAVFRLRGEGFVWVQDPREMGFRSLLEAIRAAGEEGEVEFEDASVTAAVAWQTVNRQALLWSVLEPIISQTAAGRMWADPVRRAALGTAVGRMGLTDRRKFTASLDRWARGRGALPRRQGDAVASLAGFAMAEALRREPAKQAGAVLAKMRSWVASENPDEVWAAGAAVWRIYHVALGRSMDEQAPSVRADLKVLLREMVRVSFALGTESRRRIAAEVRQLKLDRETTAREVRSRFYELGNQIRACVVYALERIGRVDTAEMVAILLEWLEDPEPQQVRRVVLLAAQRTFKQLIALDVEPQREKYLPLLRLIGGIFGSVSGASGACRSLCAWLAAWLRWEEWLVAISTALLEVANRRSDRARASLREGLSRWWLQGQSPAADAIARGVIARSYAMDGVLTELPPLGRCLLALDPVLLGGGPFPAGSEAAAKLAAARKGSLERLRAAIEAQMEVCVVLLGTDGRQSGDEQPAGAWIPSGIPGHRLLMPAIDEVAASGADLVLTVTTGPILDLEDALDTLGAKKVVVAASCDLDIPAGVVLVRIGAALSGRDVEAVETSLQAHWARTLVELPAAAWEPLLMAIGVQATDLAAPESSLDAWADRLAQPESASGRSDLGRRILSMLFWLAAADFERCLRIVGGWLAAKDTLGLRRAAGVAAGKALFRAAAHARFAGGRWAPLRLFDELAPALARAGEDDTGPAGSAAGSASLARASEDGTEAVIRAVERWLEDPDLAAGLAGAVENGRGRLLRWAEDLAPQRAASLRAALDRFHAAAEAEDLGSAGQALESTFDRLRLRLSEKRPRPLPSLEDGERYGVIVVDGGRAGDGGAPARRRLASSLFRQFEDGKRPRVRPLVYWLGDRWPFLVAGDPAPKDAELVPRAVPQPRLLGPILTAGLSPGNVGFVLVLADRMWIDGEDWVATDWRERIVTWQPLPDAAWSAVLSSLPQLEGGDVPELEAAARALRRRATRAEETIHGH
ncbi:MAG TPA: hypothetical protein VHB47_17070 [Thermoanaerobaculia bacterium]|nr:hypothetical protein [Thermoanaerobaculia bacterium]